MKRAFIPPHDLAFLELFLVMMSGLSHGQRVATVRCTLGRDVNAEEIARELAIGPNAIHSAIRQADKVFPNLLAALDTCAPL